MLKLCYGFPGDGPQLPPPEHGQRRWRAASQPWKLPQVRRLEPGWSSPTAPVPPGTPVPPRQPIPCLPCQGFLAKSQGKHCPLWRDSSCPVLFEGPSPETHTALSQDTSNQQPAANLTPRPSISFGQTRASKSGLRRRWAGKGPERQWSPSQGMTGASPYHPLHTG